ncbi:hypothetical protein Syun_003469 [Stephania yunnanensis]|uniref:UDP-glycosyltransferase n=1 Tax=Stephania yunnanensis TaxID=152371 RepID=A0AAP0L160_9MAGN
MSETNHKPHVVCVPFPGQGHVTPMLKLAKLLHHKGFYVTFINTHFIHQRLLKSRGLDSLNSPPDFPFESIPDGLPLSSLDLTNQLDIPALCDSTRKNCVTPFRDLIATLNNTASIPPVSCILSDGVMSFTLQVGKEIGVPEVLFWTPSVCGFMTYLHYELLIQRGLVPLKDERDCFNGYLETPIDWKQGMNHIQLKDLPSFIRTTDLEDIMLSFSIGEAQRSYEASAIIFNSFDALEFEVLSAIKSELKLHPIYAIGPLQLLINHVMISEENITRYKSIGLSLWEVEDLKCLNWLDSKPPNSVSR